MHKAIMTNAAVLACLTVMMMLLLSASVSTAESSYDSDGEFGTDDVVEGSYDRAEDQGAEEGYDELEFHLWSRLQGKKGRVVVSVDGFGAVGDGVADDTKAFLDAWNKACSLKHAVYLVPEGRKYKVNATKFKGPCEDKLTIQVRGTIVAPDEPKNWDTKQPRTWLVFSKLEGVRFQGGGVIDGSGSKWWASSCKINKTNPCRGAPTALTIDSSSGIRVKDLTIQNAQQMHFTISKSDTVRISNVRVRAPRDSPNTDGIHISESTDVTIQKCQIGTGDDCISIVNATSNVKMKNIACGPGHGISIGSLGKDNSTAIVTGIVLNTAVLTGTTNGLRIKTWQGGSGYVRSVQFKNVQMVDVENPIIIDQFYCDSPVHCKNQTSAVKISNIVYTNIVGTSKTSDAMKFACSNTVPCRNIVLKNINLNKENGTAETFCNCAMGFDSGFVSPAADCLRTSSGCDATNNNDQREPSPHHIIHTEL